MGSEHELGTHSLRNLRMVRVLPDQHLDLHSDTIIEIENLGEQAAVVMFYGLEFAPRPDGGVMCKRLRIAFRREDEETR